MKSYCTLFIPFRLESHHFKADPSVGVKELVAVENFTGRPFVMQFGCKFTGEPPDHGNFGSVIVEQPSQYGGNKPVLSFLLNKVCLLSNKNYHSINRLRATSFLTIDKKAVYRFASLRKQLTFPDAITGFLAK